MPDTLSEGTSQVGIDDDVQLLEVLSDVAFPVGNADQRSAPATGSRRVREDIAGNVGPREEEKVNTFLSDGHGVDSSSCSVEGLAVRDLRVVVPAARGGVDICVARQGGGHLEDGIDKAGEGGGN